LNKHGELGHPAHFISAAAFIWQLLSMAALACELLRFRYSG